DERRGTDGLDLEALRTIWSEQSRRLEGQIRLNRRLLGETLLAGARSSLQRHRIGLVIEGGLNALVLLPLGGFLFDHRFEPRFLIPGLVLDLCALLIVLDIARQIRAAAAVDYGQPVVV